MKPEMKVQFDLQGSRKRTPFISSEGSSQKTSSSNETAWLAVVATHSRLATPGSVHIFSEMRTQTSVNRTSICEGLRCMETCSRKGEGTMKA